MSDEALLIDLDLLGQDQWTPAISSAERSLLGLEETVARLSQQLQTLDASVQKSVPPLEESAAASKQATSGYQALDAAVTELRAALTEAGASFDKLTAQDEALVSANEQVAAGLSETAASSERLASANTELASANAEVTAAIERMDASLSMQMEELAASTAALEANTAALEADAVATNSAGASSEKAAGSMGSMGSAATVVAAILAGTAVEATKLGISFELAMNKSEAMAGVAHDQIAGLSQSVMDISDTTGQGSEKIAQGLYFVESAGFKGADAVKVLDIATRSAAAGQTDAKVVADALTSSLRAYGQGADQASHYADVLQATVVAGKMEYSDMAANIGKMAEAGALAGIPIEQLGASLATMTQKGMNAAQGATSITQTIMGLLAPSKQATAELQAIGMTVEDVKQSISDKGFLQTIDDMVAKTNGNIEALHNLFPNIRALRGILADTGTAGHDYADALSATTNATGGAEKAFASYETTTSAGIARLTARIKNDLIGAFDELQAKVGGGGGGTPAAGQAAKPGFWDQGANELDALFGKIPAGSDKNPDRWRGWSTLLPSFDYQGPGDGQDGKPTFDQQQLITMIQGQLDRAGKGKSPTQQLGGQTGVTQQLADAERQLADLNAQFADLPVGDKDANDRADALQKQIDQLHLLIVKVLQPKANELNAANRKNWDQYNQANLTGPEWAGSNNGMGGFGDGSKPPVPPGVSPDVTRSDQYKLEMSAVVSNAKWTEAALSGLQKDLDAALSSAGSKAGTGDSLDIGQKSVQLDALNVKIADLTAVYQPYLDALAKEQRVNADSTSSEQAKAAAHAETLKMYQGYKPWIDAVVDATAEEGRIKNQQIAPEQTRLQLMKDGADQYKAIAQAVKDGNLTQEDAAKLIGLVADAERSVADPTGKYTGMINDQSAAALAAVNNFARLNQALAQNQAVVAKQTSIGNTIDANSKGDKNTAQGYDELLNTVGQPTTVPADTGAKQGKDFGDGFNAGAKPGIDSTQTAISGVDGGKGGGAAGSGFAANFLPPAITAVQAVQIAINSIKAQAITIPISFSSPGPVPNPFVGTLPANGEGGNFDGGGAASGHGVGRGSAGVFADDAAIDYMLNGPPTPPRTPAPPPPPGKAPKGTAATAVSNIAGSHRAGTGGRAAVDPQHLMNMEDAGAVSDAATASKDLNKVEDAEDVLSGRTSLGNERVITQATIDQLRQRAEAHKDGAEQAVAAARAADQQVIADAQAVTDAVGADAKKAASDKLAEDQKYAQAAHTLMAATYGEYHDDTIQAAKDAHTLAQAKIQAEREIDSTTRQMGHDRQAVTRLGDIDYEHSSIGASPALVAADKATAAARYDIAQQAGSDLLRAEQALLDAETEARAAQADGYSKISKDESDAKIQDAKDTVNNLRGIYEDDATNYKDAVSDKKQADADLKAQKQEDAALQARIDAGQDTARSIQGLHGPAITAADRAAPDVLRAVQATDAAIAGIQSAAAGRDADLTGQIAHQKALHDAAATDAQATAIKIQQIDTQLANTQDDNERTRLQKLRQFYEDWTANDNVATTNAIDNSNKLEKTRSENEKQAAADAAKAAQEGQQAADDARAKDQQKKSGAVNSGGLNGVGVPFTRGPDGSHPNDVGGYGPNTAQQNLEAAKAAAQGPNPDAVENYALMQDSMYRQSEAMKALMVSGQNQWAEHRKILLAQLQESQKQRQMDEGLAGRPRDRSITLVLNGRVLAYTDAGYLGEDEELGQRGMPLVAQHTASR